MTGGGNREELGRVREAELRASAAVLGAGEVHFLNHTDPVGKPHRTFAPAVSVQRLSAQVAPLLENAAFAITHGSGGEYWHPAHILMHRAVRAAVGNACPVLTLHAWQADHPLPGLLNREDPADLIIDGSAHRDQRLAAFRAHRSQESYFAGHGGGSLEGYVDRTGREAFRHYRPKV
jgi:LmbE family N-acetylglucosaminyl deacetylase